MKDLSKNIGCPDCGHQVEVAPLDCINTVISKEKVAGSVSMPVKCLACGHNFKIYWIETSRFKTS